jgi:hypothetical protein
MCAPLSKRELCGKTETMDSGKQTLECCFTNNCITYNSAAFFQLNKLNLASVVLAAFLFQIWQ